MVLVHNHGNHFLRLFISFEGVDHQTPKNVIVLPYLQAVLPKSWWDTHFQHPYNDHTFYISDVRIFSKNMYQNQPVQAESSDPLFYSKSFFPDL